MKPARVTRIAHALVLGVVVSGPAWAGPETEALVRQARDLYRNGALVEALPLFEKAIEQGASGGELYYQAAFCAKTVRGDQARARDLVTKALPLLEAEMGSAKTPAPFYYVSAIYANDLADRERAAEAARLGIAGIENKTLDLGLGESRFQAARLYSLAGRPDDALPHYEGAAAAFAKETNPPLETRRQTVDQLARAYLARNDLVAASRWSTERLALGSVPEPDRFRSGMIFLRSGMYPDAVKALSHFTDPSLKVEAGYIVRVLEKVIELGPESRPEWVALDDAALMEEARKAAIVLSEIRQKDEDAMKAAEPTEPPFVWKTNRKGVKYKEYIKQVPIPEGFEVKDPNNMTPEEMALMSGIVTTELPQPPPPTPERLAAEKDFFGALLEYIGRGRLLRETSMQYGFASLIFK